jgi:hypothetical protein
VLNLTKRRAFICPCQDPPGEGLILRAVQGPTKSVLGAPELFVAAVPPPSLQEAPKTSLKRCNPRPHDKSASAKHLQVGQHVRHTATSCCNHTPYLRKQYSVLRIDSHVRRQLRAVPRVTCRIRDPVWSKKWITVHAALEPKMLNLIVSTCRSIPLTFIPSAAAVHTYVRPPQRLRNRHALPALQKRPLQEHVNVACYFVILEYLSPCCDKVL